MASTAIKDHPFYHEKDPAKKRGQDGYEWAHALVSAMRGEWEHVIDVDKAASNMAYLLGKQNILDDLRENFKKSGSFLQGLEKKAMKKDLAIAVLDRISNILKAEFLKSVYTPKVEAEDPTAEIERKRDRQMLSGRKFIESVLTDLETRVGNPPYRMPYDDFEGNVEEFDQMGFDSDDRIDVQFFMDNFHRLWHEVSAQELLRTLMKHNEFEIYVDDLINDIMAKMAVAFQTLVIPSTGEIRWKYHKPESIRAIRGERPDFKDAVCLGFERAISVRGFLEFAGPEFDWSRDKDALTRAVNIANRTDYAYITKEGCWTVSAEGEHTLVTSYAGLLKHSVAIGYIEWKSIDRIIDQKVSKKDGLFSALRSNEKENFPEEKFERYQAEAFVTYKSWFLSTGGTSQYLFRRGPLFHQLTEGASDEYSSFSISVFVGRGKSAVEISEHFIDVINKAFYKMLWAIDESKPREDVYNFDSIVQLAQRLAPTPNPNNTDAPRTPVAGTLNQVQALLESYRVSLNKLYVLPKDRDGNYIPGTQRPNYKEEGGIDPLAPAMQVVMDWSEAQISMRLGINPLRDAYAPDKKDGFKLNMAATQQSRNATYYIPWMMEKIVENTGTASLHLAQDGIEANTVVKGFLKNLIGSDAIAAFKSLNKIPLHGYGIYADVFSGEEERAELKAEAMVAFQRQEITYGQYLIVKNIEDAKKAGQILEFYRQRNERKSQEAAAITYKRQIEVINAQTNGQIAIIDRKGQWAVAEETERGRYYAAAQQESNQTALAKKQLDINSNAQKLNERAESQIKVIQAKQGAEASQVLPIATSPATPAAPSPTDATGL